MSTVLNNTPRGTVVKFTIYGLLSGRNTFEGKLMGTISGQVHPLPEAGFAAHANIYPTLPESVKQITPNDYKEYDYVMLRDQTGEVFYVGLPWVLDATVEELRSRQFTIMVEVTRESQDGQFIREILDQNNIKVVSLIQN